MADKYEKQNYSNVTVKYGSSKLFFIAIVLYFFSHTLSFLRAVYSCIVELIERNGNGIANFLEDLIHNGIYALISFYIGYLLYGLYKRFNGRAENENRIDRIFILTVIQSAVSFIAVLKIMISGADGAGQWIAAIIFAFIILALLIIFALAIRKTIKHLQSVTNGEPEGKPSALVTIILLVASLGIFLFPIATPVFELSSLININDKIDAILEAVCLISSSLYSFTFLILLTKFKKELKAVEKKYKKKYI